MPQVSGAPAKMNKIMEAAYSSALSKYPGNQKKAAKIAWGAAKNAGYKKNKQGKWTKGKVQMSEKIIEAFKVGDYPQLKNMGGEKASQQIIDDVVATYDPEKYQAPVVIGHTSDYKGATQIPAFGWIGKAIKAGGSLKLAISEFSDELKEYIQKGYYKTVSAAFYAPDDEGNPTPGKWHLHHLAFLGAAPPQVKGLEGIAFSNKKEPVEFEFADVTMEDFEGMANSDTYDNIEMEFAQCLAKVQEYMDADDTPESKSQKIGLALSDCYNAIQAELGQHISFLDKADTIIEKAKAGLQEMAEAIKSKLSFTNHKEVDMDEKTVKEFAEQKAALEAKVKALEEAALKAEKEKTEFAEKQKAEAEKARDLVIDKQIVEFKEQLTKEKYPVKLLEDQGIFALGKQLLKANELEFADGKKKAPFEILKGLIANVTPVDTTEEFSEEEVALAETTNLNDKYPVNKASFARVQFAEAYLVKHEKEVAGNTHIEKRANVIHDLMTGKIKHDPKLLK